MAERNVKELPDTRPTESKPGDIALGPVPGQGWRTDPARFARKKNFGKITGRSFLSPVQRQEMLQAWLEYPSELYVFRKTGRSKSSITRYRVLDKWDEELKLYKRELRAEVRRRMVKTNIDEMRIVRFTLAYVLAELRAGHVPVKVGDVDTTLRLNRFLSGAPDSRSETVGEQVKFVQFLTQGNGQGNAGEPDLSKIDISDEELRREVEEATAILSRHGGNGDRFQIS